MDRKTNVDFRNREMISPVLWNFQLFTLMNLRWDTNKNLSPCTTRSRLIHLPTLHNRREILLVSFELN